MDKKSKIVFVTVGTTYFDELIQKFDQENILKALSDFGYNKIIFQVGKGTYEPINYKKFDKLQGEVFKYKPSLIDDLKSAHLVMSHCGISLPLFILKLKRSWYSS